VDYRETAGTSPLAAWQEYSPVLAQQLAEYQQLRLEPLEFRGWQAADLEFLYTSGGARLRVLDRIFVTGGRAYALYWQVAEDRFSESLEEFAALSQAFVPAP
jgi:eukaryotic-like serine/threonine-protein kinase